MIKTKILVVDDEPDILELLKEWLVLEGYDVSVAKNCHEFNRLALETKPDLIILDIMLGRENGVNLYNGLLSQGFDRTIPVIFITGLAHDRPESPGMPGRTYALRTKPFNPYEIVNDIRCLVGDPDQRGQEVA
ncbi:MAG TPA: response regulator [bacterium]|nr:response regulator [bacterium]